MQPTKRRRNVLFVHLLVGALLTSIQTPLAAQAPLAQVIRTLGSVQLKRLVDSDFNTPLAAQMQLFDGDAVQSGPGGFASLIFLDDRTLLKIKENSQIQLVESTGVRTVDLRFGTLRSNLPEPIKDFRVETPNSVASVKGTDFWLVSDPNVGIDVAYGIEGVVEILNIVSGLTQNLTANTMITSTATGLITPPVPVSPQQMPVDPDDVTPVPEPEPEGDDEGPAEEGTAEGVEEAPAEPAPDAPEVPSESIFEGLTEATPSTTEPVLIDTAGTEEGPPEEEAAEATGPGLGLGLGSVTIDGKVYYQLALRPEFSIGKLAVGLDLVGYMDAQGDFRPDEWDEPSDYLDKIMYLRWGTEQDPFFFQVGALPQVQYGFGGLMSNYSNMAEFPQVRRVGFELGGAIGNKFRLKGFAADLKEFSGGGGLIGLRGTYQLSEAFPLTLGMNLVTDLNQYGGLKDKDGDGVPDVVDDFPDDKLWSVDTDGDGWADDDKENEFDRDGDGFTDQTPDSLFQPNNDIDGWDLKPPPFNKSLANSAITGLSFDLSYPIISNKLLNLMVYTEAAFLSYNDTLEAISTTGEVTRSSTGFGLIGPGLRAQILKFLNISFEYRATSPLFQHGFFNATYDLERAQIGAVVADSVSTKDQVLMQNYPVGLSGIYGSASANLFNLVTFGAAYQQLSPPDTSSGPSNSFLVNLSINTDPIPKISEAMAYYIRTNDENPFDFANPSVNTTWGFRVAYELAAGVDMVYNQQVSYRNVAGEIEEVRLLLIETAFRF